MQPIKGRGGIGQLAHTIIVGPLTTAYPSKIESQSGKSPFHKGLKKIVDDLIVHGAAKTWVGVQNDGNRRIGFFALVVATLKAPARTVKYHFRHSWTLLFTDASTHTL